MAEDRLTAARFMMNEKTLISFVIPCYRSEETIEKVILEIVDTVSQKNDYDYEIICVNDCSPDNTINVLKSLAKKNNRIRVIDLAINAGKACALMAGYAIVKGQYIATLDDDLQCPTNELWKLIDPLEKDECDIATASYYQKKQAAWKNLGSKMNVLMGRILLDKPKGLRIENFLAFKKFVIDEVIRYPYPYTYPEGLYLRATKRVKMIPMEERERGDNKGSGFTFVKSFSLWMNGFTAFSVKPLRLATIIGAFTASAGFIWGLISIVNKIKHPEVVLGYTSLLVAILLIGGVMLICLGLIGEYVGRTYICISKAPQYVIKEKINV